MSLLSKTAAARELFFKFHNRAAKDSDLAVIRPSKEQVVLLEIGVVEKIQYRPSGGEQNYEHEFEDSLPKLFVSQDGKQAYLIGGSYTFTPRGFVK